MSVLVVAYDPRWPDQFEAERARLEPVLAPWLSGGIQHIGSTSIPGLAAKPILDMLAGVDDLAAAEAAIGPLAELFYVHAPHRPRALWFYRPTTASTDPASAAQHSHHLHLTEPGSDLWQERLAFRDALRADPALAARYEELKRELGTTEDNVTDYTAGKRAFVVHVLADAGIQLQDARARTGRRRSRT